MNLANLSVAFSKFSTNSMRHWGFMRLLETLVIMSKSLILFGLGSFVLGSFEFGKVFCAYIIHKVSFTILSKTSFWLKALAALVIQELDKITSINYLELTEFSKCSQNINDHSHFETRFLESSSAFHGRTLIVIIVTLKIQCHKNFW